MPERRRAMAGGEDASGEGREIRTSVDDPVASLSGLLSEISGSGSDYKFPVRKECANLSRRLTLLSPFFEELRELRPEAVSRDAATALSALADALRAAKRLLHTCRSAGKIWLVFQAKLIADEFPLVTSQLERALGSLPFDQLEISDEVREQVELVHTQLRRAKDRSCSLPDEELLGDLQTVLSNSEIDVKLLNRLAQKLQLSNISEVEQEFQAFQVLTLGNTGNNDAGDADAEQMLDILEKLKKFVVSSEDPLADRAAGTKGESLERKPDSLNIPDDFRCPISLELMRDPVIVATGQTYERSCIQKWIDSGHKTCPKTQQTLPHLVLTPNYVLRSLITQWCEANGIEQPKRSGSSRSRKSNGLAQEIPGDRVAIDALVRKLSTGSLEEQRLASGELRMLSKRNTDNRVCIAEAGAIPLLVKLLNTSDKKAQEHAVTAILNLSIYDNNKGAIAMAGAIPAVVNVLRTGSMESRENAAATLFSLSLVDENRITIGTSGAITALVELLQEGSPRGKKDAATALFNLCIHQGNKARAVRSGILTPLMKLLVDPSSGMVDEALALLAVIASHHDGRMAIGKAHAIPLLVDLIRTGLPRNKENAASILLALCKKDVEQLAAVQRLGAFMPLADLVKNGTERAKRKATSLLEHMSKLDQLQSSK